MAQRSSPFHGGFISHPYSNANRNTMVTRTPKTANEKGFTRVSELETQQKEAPKKQKGPPL